MSTHAIKDPYEERGSRDDAIGPFDDPRSWLRGNSLARIGLFLAAAALVIFILGMLWSQSPAGFDVRERTLQLVNGDENKLVTGSYTTGSAIEIAETLLHKGGGFLGNDVMPPGVYLDNLSTVQIE